MGWKLLTWIAGMGAVGAGLAAIVVMCMTMPRTGREWAVALISTVVGSIGGGAALIKYLGLVHWAIDARGDVDLFGLAALLLLVFACGLPGWALVRWIFNYINKHQDATITDVAAELSEDAKKVKGNLL